MESKDRLLKQLVSGEIKIVVGQHAVPLYGYYAFDPGSGHENWEHCGHGKTIVKAVKDLLRVQAGGKPRKARNFKP